MVSEANRLSRILDFLLYLLNTFSAYCNINQIIDVEYDYYSFCAALADRLHMHSLTLSDALV